MKRTLAIIGMWTQLLVALQILGASILLASSHGAAAQSADQIYDVGTNVGAEYLSKYMGRLRITLLLTECKFGELANEVVKELPNSVVYFLTTQSRLNWSEAVKRAAAQVTRGYVLGYEVGVRTEFRREPSADRKRLICSAATAAAAEFIRR